MPGIATHFWAFPTKEPALPGLPAEMLALYQGAWTISRGEDLEILGMMLATSAREQGFDHGVLYAMVCEPEPCRWIYWWYRWDWWMASHPGGSAMVPPYSYA